MEVWDTIIIGTGCSGYAAAMYAGRFDMKTLVLGETLGGTIITTDVVENYPGFKKLTGLELAEKLKEHALDYDITIKEEKADKIEKKDNLFYVTTSKETYVGKTIIIATGTKWKKLNVPGEAEYANKGVHYCATCDGFAYKDKIIGVVGGSDSAAKEALLLTSYGKKVYIIYRKEKIHPEPVNMKRVEGKINEEKIEIIKNTNIKEIKGDDSGMTHVVFDNDYNGNTEFKLDGLFIEIGHIPLTELAKQLGVELDDHGYIKIDRDSKTNILGVYSAGDCADTSFKQAITGAAEGTLAAYSAYQYVEENEINPT